MISQSTRGRANWSRRALAAAAACVAPACVLPAWSANLSASSSVGLSVGYYSNPLLLTTGSTSAESYAALLNLPLTYSTQASTLSLNSRFRFSTTSGSVAPLSDYRYLDLGWNHVGALGRLESSLTWHRDSTLYNPFENGALEGASVRKTDSTGTLGWTHQLGGRNEFQLRTSAERVNYDRNAGQALVDYDYGQFSVQVARQLSPRTRIYIATGIARYQFQDHIYRSDNRFVQLAIDRALSKRWTLSARAGNSGLRTRLTTLDYFIDQAPDGTFILVKRLVDHYSTARTGNYSATLQYQYARYILDFEASRGLQPSGLGALLTEEDLGTRLSGAWTKRVDFGVSLTARRQVDSQQRLVSGDRRYATLTMNVNWRLSEHWTLGAQAAIDRQRIELQPRILNTSVFVTISRQSAQHRLN